MKHLLKTVEHDRPEVNKEVSIFCVVMKRVTPEDQKCTGKVKFELRPGHHAAQKGGIVCRANKQGEPPKETKAEKKKENEKASQALNSSNHLSPKLSAYLVGILTIIT